MWYLEEISATKRKFGPIIDSFIVGRNPKANLILKNLNVSRQHCILVLKGDFIHVQDLGSANGIFINDNKLDSNNECVLTVDDVIGVGEVDYKIDNTGDCCVFKLIKEEKNDNIENQNTENMINTNRNKRSADWESNESSIKKSKMISSNEQNQTITNNISNNNDAKSELPTTSETIKNPSISGLNVEIKKEFVLLEGDDSSVDMFSEIPCSNENKNVGNVTECLSLLDSDDDENFSYTNHVHVKQEAENNLVPDDYIIISSDEEGDNPWLEKLSQRSVHSPPPETNTWYSSPKGDAEDHEWWPVLSQNILQEFEREDQEVQKSSSDNILLKTKLDINEPGESSKIEVTNEISAINSLRKTQLENKDTSTKLDKLVNDKTRSLVIHNVKKERPAKYSKPPIIEPPTMAKPIKITKPKVEKTSKTKEKKPRKTDKKEKKDSKRKTDSKLKTDSVVKIENKKDDKIIEMRKKRLKEIADQKTHVTENATTTNSDKKERSKPKVKYTATNRSDLFTAEILKNVDKPRTSKSNNLKKSKVKINEKSLEEKYKSQISKKDFVKAPQEILSETLKISNTNVSKNEDSNCKPQFLIPRKVCSGNPVPILKSSTKQNIVRKKVTFDLTPRIKIFIEEIYEKSIPIKRPNMRDHKYLRNVARDECFYEEDVIYDIVNMEPKTLLTPNTPPELMKTVKKNSIVYDNFQNYYSTFKDLMLLELWSLIRHEYNLNDSLKRVFQVDIKHFYMFTEKMQQNRKLLNLECQLLLTKEDDQKMIHPKVGDAVIIKLIVANSNGTQESVNRFGYVHNMRKHSINQSRDELPLDLISSVNNPQVLVNFMVLTKWNSSLITDKCVHVRRVGRISGIMKDFTALQKLPSSPLMPLILNPTMLTDISYYLEETLDNNLLNSDQREIIYQVCGSCLQSKPSLNLIHGPPGTGKTYVILNIIIHLLYGNDRYIENLGNRNVLPRILICAPTNAAIDDITIKLLELRRKIVIPEHRFRMVRVGQINKMHSTVQLISSQTLSVNNAKARMFKESRNYSTGNSKQDSLYHSEMLRIYEEDLLIKKADIVCTTLGSSYTSQLERLSKNPTFRFTTCIIDEASQCTEPDSLLPVLLGIDSLVLVGDTCQLPATIKSQEAKKYGLGQSLFERIEKCFPANHDCKNIKRLNTQYRMHPDIMEFPNKYFYNGRLLSGANVYQYKFPLIPYHLFIHEFEQCSAEDNSKEAHIIINMIKAILQILGDFKVSIGIITPYHNQRTKILKLLDGIQSVQDIVVNTVDGFQGQEKDIIILSCVRTEGFGFLADDQRINVALTRAKYSFYVVGNFQALQLYTTWKALKMDADHRKKVFYAKNVITPEEVFLKVLKNKNYT